MNYIHQIGDPQARPPYIGREVLMQGGFVKVGRRELETHCDTVLNQVDPDVRFRVVGDRVMYAALYAQRMSSDHPEDRLFGSVPEIDVGLWTLVLGGKKGKFPRLYWLPLFIFVDSAAALVTGREMYGYPKQYGWMSRTAGANCDFGVTLSAVAFKYMDPSEIGRKHEVLRVERKGAKVNGAAVTDSANLLDDYRGEIAADGTDLDATGLLPPFVGMPMIFLRQMRDATAVDGATAREIVTVTVQPTKAPVMGFAGGQTLHLHDLASFPFQTMLGRSGELDIDFCFWAELDFIVGAAQRIA